MANLYLSPFEYVYDDEGVPRVGAKLAFFEAGTSTPLATYAELALTTPNPNPMISDSSGKFGIIYLQDVNYKVTLSDADDVLIWTVDDFNTGDITAKIEYANSSIEQAITTSGQILDDTDFDQLSIAINKYSDGAKYYTDTTPDPTPDTTVSSYTVEIPAGELYLMPIDYYTGMIVKAKITYENEATPTINVEGLGDKNIKNLDETALTGGEIKVGWNEFTYDGTDFLITNDNLALAKKDLSNVDKSIYKPYGLITGLNSYTTITSWNSGTGACATFSGNYIVNVDSAVTKKNTLFTLYSEDGNTSGGFPLAPVISTWYYTFIIYNPDSGNIDAGYDTDITATNLLAEANAQEALLPSGNENWTEYRRVGSIRTQSSNGFVIYYQYGDEFIYEKLQTTGSGAISPTNTSDVITLEVPPGINVLAKLFATFDITTSSNNNLEISPNSGEYSRFIDTNSIKVYEYQDYEMMSDTSRQILLNGDTPNTPTVNYVIKTSSWIDKRQLANII